MSTVMAAVVTSRHNSPTPAPGLSLNTSVRGTPAAVPNKHLPTCSPGPRPGGHRLSSPTPASPSPASPAPVLESSSLLHPPSTSQYPKLSTRPSVYSITASQLQAALNHIASQPLPDPKHVFPWMHGLHPENSLQLAFFIARKRAQRRQPRCIRGITLVKAGGDLTSSKLKGAIAPEELLFAGRLSEDVPQFMDADPREGFSVRNFQIQAAKLATVSDIVVYGDDQTSKEEVKALASRIANAQKAWRDKDREAGVERPLFSTFVLSDPFSTIEEQHPDIVAVGSNNCLTGKVLDFFQSERLEMQAMSRASEIAHNVWLGPTLDPELEDVPSHQLREKPVPYDLLIECGDMAQLPSRDAFRVLETLLSSDNIAPRQIPQLDFPGSGSIMPPTWSHAEADGLMNSIVWIHEQANGKSSPSPDAVSGAEAARKRKDSKVSFSSLDSDGDSIMGDGPNSISPVTLPSAGRKFLLHCSDGYTETTLLAVAYYMYATCTPLHKAYIDLHAIHKRNFFAYPSDMALLNQLQTRILSASPANKSTPFSRDVVPPTPAWWSKVDGSLPSRIMSYMYLGNLNHANNPGLLKEMGIAQVLSIGEDVTWTDTQKRDFCGDDAWEWDEDRKSGRWMYVGGVQDNGVDPLTGEFGRCLEFIRKGREEGKATLVHCRVGVSRSATICIAEVMNELGYSFPKAYCFVRARRLNVIIQPHLRFSYELLKYEEFQAQKWGRPFKRELEWSTIAREIAAMNRPYSRQ